MMKKAYNPTLDAVVTLLSDGQYHDGDTIGRALNITRSAVWKAIKRLQSYGVSIDSVKGKGYALQSPLILLRETQLQSALAKKNIDVMVFESIPSTNSYLQKNKLKLPVLCVAEQQTAGKGRLGRAWYSPFGLNVYLSYSFRFEKDMSELAGLSLLVGLVIRKTLASFLNLTDVKVKWPNDIYLDSQKLAGVLIDVQAESHGASQVIIGIGLNVNMMRDDENVSQEWTSLQKLTRKYIDRNVLIVKLIEQLYSYLNKFSESGLASFLEEWQSADYLFGKKIALKNGEMINEGEMLGVNASGYLILLLKNGEKKIISSGDASIVKK